MYVISRDVHITFRAKNDCQCVYRKVIWPYDPSWSRLLSTII